MFHATIIVKLLYTYIFFSDTAFYNPSMPMSLSLDSQFGPELEFFLDGQILASAVSATDPSVHPEVKIFDTSNDVVLDLRFDVAANIIIITNVFSVSQNRRSFELVHNMNFPFLLFNPIG